MKYSGDYGNGKGAKRMGESFEQFREGKKNMKEKGFKWCVTPKTSDLSNRKW